jgi:hypothetical protein
MSSWDHRTVEGSGRTDPRALPKPTRPVDCSDEEFSRRLWQETDRSLRQDPERWVVKSSGKVADNGASGITAYTRAAAAEFPDRSPDAREANLSAASLRGWETRRARARSRPPEA